MKIFRLPDLGEGLPDAEVNQWHVKVGDEVKADEPLVSMETAKAVVEVPAPRSGKIIKLHGNAGDIIKTGAPLVEFADGEEDNASVKTTTATPKTVTTEPTKQASADAIFHLPDLGEGLPDAEINQWHVKEGDEIKTDEPLASMETAKAVVEVPSPRSGKIKKLYGKVGDIIKTHAPLVEFESTSTVAISEDAGTVVGNIEVSGQILDESPTGVKPLRRRKTDKIKALPAARILAKNANIDLITLTPTGPQGIITVNDVKAALTQTSATVATTTPTGPAIEGAKPLRGVRRQMAIAMSQSHKHIVPVTLIDDADIHAWPKKTDITYRLIRAIVVACKQEPTLNAWFDTQHNARKLHDEVHLGLAMDSADGLFVPVIKNVEKQSAKQLREHINTYKTQVRDRSIPPENLRDGTITLSNFGMFAGKYANPIIVPPTVAILGCGRLHEQVVAANGKPEIHRVMPLSLTFDHRAATGGEAARFLAAVIADLQLAK